MANRFDIKQRANELIRGDVVIEWDQDQWLASEYEYYQEDQADLLAELEIRDQEAFDIWYLNAPQPDNDFLSQLWGEFEELFKTSRYYAEVYSTCGWWVRYEYKDFRDAHDLWETLGIEGYKQFKVTKVTDQGFPGLEVEWYSYRQGHNGRAFVVAREDSICPTCDTVFAHDSEAGQQERAFIRKWGGCPYCIECSIQYFCQGDRTDDTAFLYQPGDYLMDHRLGEIRVDMSLVGYYLSEQTLELLGDVKKPAPGYPGHYMYGR
jgi:hypothetical protein